MRPARSTSAGTVSGKSIINPRIGFHFSRRKRHPTIIFREFRAPRHSLRRWNAAIFIK
jgi:hypothetical protein